MTKRTAELRDVLSFRERKSFIQEDMNGGGMTTIALSINVPGPQKRSPKLDYLFRRSVEALEELLSENHVFIRKRETVAEYGGETLVLGVEKDPYEIKDMVMALELAEPVGRFLDCDVNRPDGTKVSRTERGFPSRKCYLCGNDAKVCGRSRAHSVEELFSFMGREIDSWMRSDIPDRVTRACKDAMKEELLTYPKPGLVDPHTNGAHEDMDADLFMKSIEAIIPHIRRMCLMAYDTDDADELHDALKQEGMEAEKDMFLATGGVNTHKGAIFTMGLFAAVAVRILKEDLTDTDSLREELSRISEPFRKELLDVSAVPATNGGKEFLSHPGSGIRGEISSGYESVFGIGIPALIAAREAGLSYNDMKLYGLVSLMAETEDSNILHRCGEEGLKKVKADAGALKDLDLFRSGEHIEKLIELDEEYSRLGLSGGGSGDLLIAAIFVCGLFGG